MYGFFDRRSRPRISLSDQFSITSYVACQGGDHAYSFCSQSAPESRKENFKASSHLKDGKRQSFLGIPLHDRKGTLVGLIKAENKELSKVQDRDNHQFTEQDTGLIESFARKIIPIIQRIKSFDALKGVIQLTRFASSTRDLQERICVNARKFGPC